MHCTVRYELLGYVTEMKSLLSAQRVGKPTSAFGTGDGAAGCNIGTARGLRYQQGLCGGGWPVTRQFSGLPANRGIQVASQTRLVCVGTAD